MAEALYGAASWIHEYHAKISSYRDAPKSMRDLQDAVSKESRAGYQDHHINEKTSAERAKFPKSMIEGRENVVRIPTMRHEDINGWCGRPNKDYGNLSPRECLHDKSWEERQRVGIRVLIDHKALKP